MSLNQKGFSGISDIFAIGEIFLWLNDPIYLILKDRESEFFTFLWGKKGRVGCEH